MVGQQPGRVAIVTGASSGIGQHTANLLARQGWTVVLVARNAERLRAVAEEIGELAVIEALDAADGTAVLAMRERILATHGIPELIVNAAGAGRWLRIEDTPPYLAVEMMKAPYFAAFNMSHAFMRDMLDRDRGVLIHVNSPAALMPWPSSVGYGAARWALRGLHELLCQDLAGTGVRSCQIVFGKVDTAYFSTNPGVEERLPKIGFFIRTLSPRECATVIVAAAHGKRREIVHPLMLRLSWVLGRLSPSLAAWLMRLGSART